MQTTYSGRAKLQHVLIEQSVWPCLTRQGGVNVAIDGVVFLPAFGLLEPILALPLSHLSIPTFALIKDSKQQNEGLIIPLALVCERT